MIHLPSIAQPAPALELDTADGGRFVLADRSPDAFTMVVAYRGLHCPVCKSYLQTIHGMLDDFAEKGVDVVAVSMDGRERAEESVEKWEIPKLTVGYDMTAETARSWGLHLSTAISDGEPDLFSEPGLFLIRPDGELFYTAINSMPFGRPDPERMLKSIQWIQDNDYPSRGRVS